MSKRTIFLTAISLGLVASGHASALSGVQLSYDAQVMLIQKDVRGERWAISHDPLSGTITGNVFFPDDRAPAFVWCGVLSQSQETVDLECFGAPACPAAPCSSSEWSSLGEVSVPASFLSPPGGTPLAASLCPPDMEAIGALCIDRAIRPAKDFNEATKTCHGLGRSLCGLDAFMACDAIEPSKGPGDPVSCGDATDDPELTVWTLHTHADPDNPSPFGNVTCYKGSNTIVNCRSGDSQAFFCCSQTRR